MFDVGGITSGNTGSNAAPAVTGSSNILGRDDFLMLLIAELQHQDPLEPLKNQEYISQLTQFTSLDELRGIRAVLASQQNNAATQLNAQSIGMIGREVTVLDNSIEHVVGRQARIQFQLPSDAQARVTIYNSRGQVVRQDSVVGGRLAGWQEYVWNGRNDDGNLVPAGNYYALVTSVPDGSGNSSAYQVFQSGRVTGVDFSGTQTMLELEGGGRVPFSSIVAVREVNSDNRR